MSVLTHPIYEPLPHTREYLRVLTVHAGNASDPIRCNLQTVSFREETSYEALSYTWGDPTTTRSIEVDGSAIQVTSNLEQALRHLRDVENDLTLWVDAICINQSDTTEKSHQVALMGQIYRECARVRIWLGCDASQCRLGRSLLSSSNAADDNSEGVDPLGLLRMLAEDKHIHQWPCFRTQASHKGDVVTYNANHNFDSIYEAFLAIERSPWWTRMWTVQEAILPKMGLLTYDTWTMSLQSVIDAGQSYFGHFLKDCCQHAALQLPMIIRSTVKMFCRLAVSFYGDRKGSQFEDNLHERHTAFGYRECEDPRDKVYGLLGIVGDSLLTPDYTLSKSEVFFQATYSMLSVSGGTLQSLTGPQYGPAPGKWAAWVRNFDAPSNYIDAGIAWDRLTLHDSGIYNACDSHRSNSVFVMARARPGGGKTNQVGLETVGRRVGIVTFVSQAGSSLYQRDEMKDSFRRWMLEALDWDVMHEPAYPSNSSNTCGDPDIVMRFWRTLLGGTGIRSGIGFEHWDRFAPTAISLLDEFLAWLREEIDELSYTLNSSLVMSTHGRCYFKAENDSHGLCYPGTCIGDEVWVLDGGRVPFILRPAHLDQDQKQALRPLDEEAFREHGRYEFREDRQPEKAPEGYYQFIGDCYLDGVMNGEAVRNSTLREQTIVLV